MRHSPTLIKNTRERFYCVVLHCVRRVCFRRGRCPHRPVWFYDDYGWM